MKTYPDLLDIKFPDYLTTEDDFSRFLYNLCIGVEFNEDNPQVKRYCDCIRKGDLSSAQEMLVKYPDIKKDIFKKERYANLEPKYDEGIKHMYEYYECLDNKETDKANELLEKYPDLKEMVCKKVR